MQPTAASVTSQVRDADDSPGTIRTDPRRRSFAQIPEQLLLADIPALAKVLWGILDRQARGREVAIDSRNKLAVKLRCSSRNVTRCLDDLIGAGWLGVEHSPGRVSRYTLYDEPVHPAGGVDGSVHTPDGGLDGSVQEVETDRSTHTRAVPGLRDLEEGEAPTPTPPTPPTTQPQAPPGKPPTYVGRCPAHSEHPNPPNCIPCKNARLALQAQPAAATPAQVKCRTHLIEHGPGGECRSCRADRIAGDARPTLASTA